MEGMDRSELPVYPTATTGPAGLIVPTAAVATPGAVFR
jgi:hypothetical protein